MRLYCTQDGMKNIMMQHAGCIPTELIVQAYTGCNGRSVLEHYSMSFTISRHTSTWLSDGMLMKQST